MNVAPIIPGLNDEDIPKILAAARDAGARSAGHVLLRLPGSVKAVFEERLRAALPLTADRVLHRMRETRGGQLYDSRFGVRGRGEGTYADAIQALFEAAATRHGFRRGAIPSDVQVDAQDSRKTCMSIAMPAAMTAAEPATTESRVHGGSARRRSRPSRGGSWICASPDRPDGERDGRPPLRRRCCSGRSSLSAAAASCSAAE